MHMNKSAVIHARIEPETKLAAENILHRIGISPTEAIRIFYRQITMRKGLPFSVEIPNEVTRTTLRSSKEGKDLEEFGSLDAMIESWGK